MCVALATASTDVADFAHITEDHLIVTFFAALDHNCDFIICDDICPAVELGAVIHQTRLAVDPAEVIAAASVPTSRSSLVETKPPMILSHMGFTSAHATLLDATILGLVVFATLRASRTDNCLM